MKITKQQLKQIIKEEIEAVLRETGAEEECSEKHEKGSKEYEVCMNTKRANAAAKEQGFKDGMPSPWHKDKNKYGPPLGELRKSDVERSLEDTAEPDEEFEEVPLSPEEKKDLKRPENKDNPYYRHSAREKTLRKKR